MAAGACVIIFCAASSAPRYQVCGHILRFVGPLDHVGVDGIGFGFLQVAGEAGHAFFQARAAQDNGIPKFMGGRIHIA